MRSRGPVWAEGQDTLVRVQVQPGASRTECVGRHGDCVRIRVAEPPVGGRANAGCIAFVARQVGIVERRVSIQSGAGSRRKLLRITGVAPEAVRLAFGIQSE